MGTVVRGQGVPDEVVVRFYNRTTDLEQVNGLEKMCDTGGSDGEIYLMQDLHGDPLNRVRHYQVYSMMVAVVSSEIVGVIRAGIKNVVCESRGMTTPPADYQREPLSEGSRPIFARTAYLMGLRVSPGHRRLGIGLRLASRMEEWCKMQGVQYVYFATTKDNEASLGLFTRRLRYVPFRYPVLMGHPIYRHSRQIPSHIEITKLSVEAAVAMYRSVMGGVEFFPEDIDAILNHKLCGGTWVASIKQERHSGLCCGGSCRVSENVGTIESSFASCSDGRPRPHSWAVFSLWKCNEIFSLELKGVGLHKRTAALISRYVDRALPWLHIPSFPKIFTPFGLQFMFGLHAEGPKGNELLRALCFHAHNVSRKDGCQVLLTQVGASDPLRGSIPHWPIFSTDEDVWCVKNLASKSTREFSADRNTEKDQKSFDWCNSPAQSSSALFVDPRDV